MVLPVLDVVHECEVGGEDVGLGAVAVEEAHEGDGVDIGLDL